MYLKNTILPFCKNTLPKGISKKKPNVANNTKKVFLAWISKLGGLYPSIDPKPQNAPQNFFLGFRPVGQTKDPLKANLICSNLTHNVSCI